MTIHVEGSKRVRIEVSPGDDVEITYTKGTLPDKVNSVMRAIGARQIEYVRTRADEELYKRLRFAVES